jgi:hypothetical protein
VLLQLEAPVRVEIVLLVQPLDALLAEAGHFRIGEEALRVPLPAPSPAASPSALPPAADPHPAAPAAAPSTLHNRGTSFGNIIQEHHSRTSFRNIIQEHLGEHSGEHLGREVGGQFARNIRGSI